MIRIRFTHNIIDVSITTIGDSSNFFSHPILLPTNTIILLIVVRGQQYIWTGVMIQTGVSEVDHSVVTAANDEWTAHSRQHSYTILHTSTSTST